MFATVRPTLSDGPVYAGAPQSTAVAVVHDVVPQVRMLTWLVTVRSAEAKPRPVIVREVAPVAAPFGRASCVTIAASYVNMYRIVPTTAETVSTAPSLAPLPLGTRHCTTVSVFHCVDVQTVFPSTAVALYKTEPKLTPFVVITPPPVVGPLSGDIAVRTGASNVTWARPVPTTAEIVRDVASAVPDPAVCRQRTVVPVVHADVPHAE
jgi:hypothetical protein